MGTQVSKTTRWHVGTYLSEAFLQPSDQKFLSFDFLL